jgi:hypothetical protein
VHDYGVCVSYAAQRNTLVKRTTHALSTSQSNRGGGKRERERRVEKERREIEGGAGSTGSLAGRSFNGFRILIIFFVNGKLASRAVLRNAGNLFSLFFFLFWFCGYVFFLCLPPPLTTLYSLTLLLSEPEMVGGV